MPSTDDAGIARAVHVAAVVVWIGGAAMATTVILPLVRSKEWPIEMGIILFEAVERRFVRQARTAVVLVGLSGFYMVGRYGLWSRFAATSFWWMHAMVAVWFIFTLLLFVIEPFILCSRVRRAPSTDEPTFAPPSKAGVIAFATATGQRSAVARSVFCERVSPGWVRLRTEDCLGG